jgi:hypothetical protein
MHGKAQWCWVLTQLVLSLSTPSWVLGRRASDRWLILNKLKQCVWSELILVLFCYYAWYAAACDWDELNKLIWAIDANMHWLQTKESIQSNLPITNCNACSTTYEWIRNAMWSSRFGFAPDPPRRLRCRRIRFQSYSYHDALAFHGMAREWWTQLMKKTDDAERYDNQQANCDRDDDTLPIDWWMGLDGSWLASRIHTGNLTGAGFMEFVISLLSLSFHCICMLDPRPTTVGRHLLSESLNSEHVRCLHCFGSGPRTGNSTLPRRNIQFLLFSLQASDASGFIAPSIMGKPEYK